MIRHFVRRFSFVLTACMMLCIVIIAGCRGKDENESEVVKSYKSEDIDLGVEENDYTSISNINFYNGYVYYQRWDSPEYPQEYYDTLDRLRDMGAPAHEKSGASDNDDKNADSDDIKTYDELYKKYEDYKTVCGMYKFNPDSKETIHLFDFEDENYKIRDYYINSSENMIILHEINNYNEKTMMSDFGYEIDEFSSDGKKLNSVNIDDMFGKKSDFPDSYMNSNIFKIADEEHIFINNGDNSVIVVNSKGEEKGRIDSEKYISDFAVDADNNVILYCTMGDDGEYIKADSNTYRTGDKLEGITDSKDYSPYTLIRGNSSSPLMLRDSNYLYTYDYNTRTKTEVLRWIDAGIIGESINDVVWLDDGRIFYSLTNPNDGIISSGIISECDENSNKDKEVIKVMMLQSDNEIQEKIINYNKEDNQYRIELISFDNDDDAETNFNNKIITGNIPDIIDIATVDMKNYIAKDILEDMTSYIEEDDTVNENYFIDGYLDATKTDGKQYYLARCFEIDTLVGKASELNKYKDGWRIRDIIDYYKSKPSGTELFFEDSKIQAFRNLILSDLDSYIDWDSGEVMFEGQEFREVLEFCNSFPPDNEDITYDMSNISNDIADGKVLLRQDNVDGSMEIQVLKKMFSKDYTFVGYPCREGIGTYMNFEHAFGICAGSDNKDGAWDVIKTLISVPKKSQMMVMMHRGIPASKEEFEEVIIRDTAKEKYIDKYGNEIYPRDTSYGYNDYELRITPATNDEIETLKELIRMAHGTNRNSYKLDDMLIEDVTPYFEGKKTIDEVVKIIQDKMSKYVNENK